MRSYSVLVGHSIAVVDVDQPGHYHPEFHYIARVNVPSGFRRAGVGTALMAEMCRDADAERATMILAPLPYPGQTDPMTRETLICWYERFGFVIVDDGPWVGHMVRRCTPNPT